MEAIILLVLFFGIGLLGWLGLHLQKDKVKITIDARLFASAPRDGTGALNIIIKNFGPRSARIDRVVIDGDITIISEHEDWEIDGTTLRPAPLKLPAHTVSILDLKLRRFYNARTIWVHGYVVETGTAWTSKAAIIYKR